MPQNCPVCNKVNENRAKCSRCSWDLTPLDLSQDPKTILEKSQNDQNWAKMARKQLMGLQEVPEKIDYLTQCVKELSEQKNTPLPISNLEENSQVPESINTIEQLKSQIQQLSEKVEKLENKVKELENNQKVTNLSQDRARELENNQVTQFPNALLSLPEIKPLEKTEQYNSDLSYLEEEIVRQYNLDSLSDNVIEVGVTGDSINKYRTDINQPLELKKSNRGGYSIIEKGDSYYLVPTTGRAISSDRYHSSTKILFECLNYQEEITINCRLIKPAKVSLVGEIWQLKERGVLQFN